MKILIIEDEENLAKLMKKSLESEGYAVDYLTDGESGQTRIEYNRRNRPLQSAKVSHRHDDHAITCLQFCDNRIIS